jgi:hypothetical protein
MTNPPYGGAMEMGGTGLIDVDLHKPDWVGNGIWMRFTVSPTGIWNEPAVAFDVTRRIERKHWWLDVNRNPISSPYYLRFPVQNELANDDDPAADESFAPDVDGNMWSIDAPARITPPGEQEEYFDTRFNAEEFVRVRFNGQKPDGNGVLASRASDKFNWHLLLYLQNDHAGWWIRTPGDPQEIGPVHVPIGENP